MPKDQILLDPARTALVMIDLQNGILAQSLHPRSSDMVLENARNLIAKFRSANAPIVLVRVYWSSDMADAPHQMVDLPSVPAESTARSAWEHGYNIVIAEDTTATKSVEMHQFSITEILPRIARVRQSAELTFTIP